MGADEEGTLRTLSDQRFAGYFRTHPNREIFGGLQGINLSDQGNYSPYQGIRILSNSG
jgi:hypothetical protein